jgi:hypothetical protein
MQPSDKRLELPACSIGGMRVRRSYASLLLKIENDNVGNRQIIIIGHYPP